MTSTMSRQALQQHRTREKCSCAKERVKRAVGCGDKTSCCKDVCKGAARHSAHQHGGREHAYMQGKRRIQTCPITLLLGIAQTDMISVGTRRKSVEWESELDAL